jgi:4-hydroxy-3-polyprenylbenzoate decarboxylase
LRSIGVASLYTESNLLSSPEEKMGEIKDRLVVGISGASGVILGIRLLEVLQSMEIETHLVVSPAARLTISQETDWEIEDVMALADVSYDHADVGAAIASGSFPMAGMAIIPCSIKTLSAIANSYSADLIVRAADVMLKEGRPLVLVLRESPLHRGHLRLMSMAAEAGALIFPPVPAFYTRPASLDEIIDNIVGRVLLRLGIENELYMKWKGVGR